MSNDHSSSLTCWAACCGNRQSPCRLVAKQPLAFFFVPSVYSPLSASSSLPQRFVTGGADVKPLTESHRTTSQTPPDQTKSSLPAHRWITDNLLLNYQRCSRRAYLDVYGDRTQADPPSDYLLKIRQDSAALRQSILADYDPIEHPVYPHEDWQAGATATQALMAQGANFITGAVLLRPVDNDHILVSRPDLLIKQPGWSYWGDWQYIPVDIRLGKKPKLDYQIVATFHGYVLAAVQGSWPTQIWLALREGRYHVVDLDQQLPKLSEVLEACLRDLQHDVAPEVFISHSRCDLCHWFSQCYQTAREVNHLSLLPGVTPARYVHLQGQHLVTLADLAQANPAQLAHLPGFGEAVAEKLVHQAQATLYNRAIARTHPHARDCLVLHPHHLPSADIELYFDIEAAPDVDVIYLHGVLVVNHRNNTECFHPFLAESEDQERTAWEDFLALVLSYPQAPIYHFCPYEAQTVRKLSRHYNSLPADAVEKLLDRFVDIHWCVTEAVTLPVESYALKHIARWMGFHWRDSDANGAQSICWYNDWLTTGDRAALEAILRYNEDDCRATYHVKNWLTEFFHPHWQTTTMSYLTASA